MFIIYHDAIFIIYHDANSSIPSNFKGPRKQHVQEKLSNT